MSVTKDAYYFSHDSNAKDDPKCVLLIEQLGMEGYGIFWVLVETLRDQPNYKYPLSLLNSLARKFNTTCEKVKVVVQNYGLFTIENDEFFFSESLNRRMVVNDRRREISRIAGEASARKRMLLAENLTCVEHTLNASLTKKRKEKKGEENISYDAFFEMIWALYPNKKGKGQVRDAQKRKLQQIGLSQLKRCIERFEIDTRGRDKQYLPYGSTFFNSGYIDYLDENWKPEQQEKSKYRDMTGDTEYD